MILSRGKKLKMMCSVFVAAVIALTPLAGAGNSDAQESHILQASPVNPDFLRFVEEPPEHFYGYVPSPMDLSHLDAIPVQGIVETASLPPRFDWRDEDRVTSVKNQNPCGTCWAFGTLAALESRVLIGEDVAYTPGDAAYDYSEQNLICCTDPAWVYLDGNRCDGGGNSQRAADTLSKEGVRPEACQPYNTTTLDSEGCNKSCEPVKMVTGYRMIAKEATSSEMVAPIKNAIYNHGSLTMSYHHDHTRPYTDNIYHWPDCTEPANHCVSIIGWDDDITHPADGGSGAWIVKNSWGTGWGDGGYFYLCYGSASMSEVAALDYRGYDPDETIYYWDEAGQVGSFGYWASSAWMANIFVSTGEGILTHVDFWTTSHNAQYEIYVYLDDDITDGLDDLAASQTGACQEFGYYSIPLNLPVLLGDGQPFILAVKMTTPDYGLPIPVETVVGGLYACSPPIQPNVSFIRHGDVSSWTDAADYDRNLCLRARVRAPDEEPGIIYVDVSVPGGADDGSSWENAFDSLQDGLDAAAPGDEIWVAQGVYRPSAWPNGGSKERERHFSLENGVEVYGGFQGNETSRDQRDWEANPTILSGDIGTEGDGSDNCYHVFYHPDGTELDSSAVLDGFTVAAGSATGLEHAQDGAGMYNYGSSPTLANCAFSGNSADRYGGGMSNWYSSPTLVNCTFSDNSADLAGGMSNWESSPALTGCAFSGNSAGSGGGMSNYGGSSPVLTDCTFSGNSAEAWGGGMHNDESSPTLSGCTFSANSAVDFHGGGMYNHSSSAVMTGCTFSDNSAGGDGGGMCNTWGSSPALINCMFSGNSAEEGGGGMYNDRASSPTLTNCGFFGNSAWREGGGMVQHGGGMYNNDESSPALINCVFSGNFAQRHGGAMYNLEDSAPTLTNCTFSGNRAGIDGGGMYNNNNYSFSPALINCIMWGDSADGSGDEIHNRLSVAPTFSYCNIAGSGGSGTGWDGSMGVDGGNNIDADPVFVQQPDPAGAPTTGGDLCLQADSPCIDAGNNEAVAGVSTDFAGNPRIVDGDGDGTAIVDIGAYEFVDGLGPRITVDPTSFEVTLLPDTTQDYTLTIGNTGDVALTYDITVQETAGVSGVAGGESVRDVSNRYTAGSLLLMERAGMMLGAPPGRSRVEIQDSGQTESGWQNIMTEDFEGVFPGDWQLWVAEGAAHAYWGQCDYNPHSGDYSAFCAISGTEGVDPPANYPDNMNTWMIYGPFSLEDATDAVLEFWVWYDTQINSDWVDWMASIDGYNFYGPGLSDYSQGWVSKSFDLTDVYTLGNLCGQPQVWIAFVFTSDSVNTAQGVFIDDVVLRKYVEGVNHPPHTPSSPSPAHHVTGVSVDSDLSWTGGDPDPGDAATYDVYFDSTGATTLVSTDQSATTYDPGTLDHNTTYYWKIVARDDHGLSTTGPVWEFTTAAEAQADFWLDVNPESGSVAAAGSADLTVTVNTAGLDSGTYYAEIVIANNDLMNDPVVVPVTLHVSGLPTVTTGAATDIGPDFATLNMSYTLGDHDLVEVCFSYRKATDVTWTETSWVAESAPGTHAETITGLDTDTLYHFKARLKYDTTEIEGAERQFTAGQQAEITGVTREVNCNILPGVTVTLYQNGTEVASTVSGIEGFYTLAVPGPGEYTVVAGKAGFRDEQQSASIDELTTYTVHFVCSRGLIPNAPNMSYVLACINLWQFGEPPCKLTMSRVLAVINAWQFPVLAN